MSTKKLTQAEVRMMFAYNARTGLLRWKIRRQGARIGGRAGGPSGSGYLKVCVHGSQLYVHRIVWLHVHGYWPTQQLDHINGVKWDNRIKNLRQATHSQNQHNQLGPQSGNRSGFLGVTHVASVNRWKAQICINRKRKYLGIFATPQLAHEAYLAAKRKLHPFSIIK